MPTTFHLLTEPKSTADIAPWDTVLGRFSLIIGYTSLGDFLLVDSMTSEHAVLLTLEDRVEETGYNHTEEFVRIFLTHPEVVDHVLRPQFVEELMARLGPLGVGEVYYPVPYPFLGGTGDLKTFNKGSVWVFASIAGQSWSHSFAKSRHSRTRFDVGR
jgi:hypothetical protein